MSELKKSRAKDSRETSSCATKTDLWRSDKAFCCYQIEQVENRTNAAIAREVSLLPPLAIVP
jgi:hypothetical protein